MLLFGADVSPVTDPIGAQELMNALYLFLAGLGTLASSISAILLWFTKRHLTRQDEVLTTTSAKVGEVDQKVDAAASAVKIKAEVDRLDTSEAKRLIAENIRLAAELAALKAVAAAQPSPPAPIVVTVPPAPPPASPS